MKLQNRVCIVSGGGRDIGRSISLKLAEEGAKLVINYFGSQEKAEKTLEEVKALGAEAILVRGDMTDPQAVADLVAQCQQAFGEKIDVLVNVAGGLVARKTIEEMSLEFFDKVLSLNLTSTFLLTKHVSPHMAEGGVIINLSSQAARDGGGPGASAYATAKGAVMTFTRAMAKELGPRGIRVNSVCPGMISTTFHDTFTASDARKNVAGATALRREGSPDEVAGAVAYLASDDATFVTGLNMDINGGLLFS